MSERRVEVPVLTRVEGEGALHVRIENGSVTDLRLRIFEPPRFFEQFLVGRTWKEVTDIVTRICGICPVAYQMSASHAIEQAFGVAVTPEIRALRRLYYCGEWIESHSLHIHLLAAPDFYGQPNVMALAKVQPEAVRRGMRLQGIGNRIIALLSGRPVNPVGVRPGGFYRAPEVAELRALAGSLREALPEAEAMVRWTAGLAFPTVERDAPFVSLRHPDEYPMNEGRIASSAGVDISAADFADRIREHQVPHSTALHAHLDGRPYWVGPLPRLNNNLDRLPPETARLMRQTGIAFPSANPYHSIVARALEVHLSLIEALRVAEGYTRRIKPHVEVEPRSGTGTAATEAPRGILWHRYAFDTEGVVRAATIVPPTSQNQAQMEADLRASVLESLALDDDRLRHRLEADIRNYDPCISCSTHFLKLNIERTDRD
ncbi:Ni/Fe hydrogenase subunit alpha [Sulfurifustis variabilis]|uniref:Ni/Fe hydrogenase subunit alpha n=1 Tax=Sulfurifustis variabilis TaxID=1675686 RepID=A0A1B4V589_9GAMM|nr:Ni/Fe hydrogenase subunit alpha [Sulfurifustis variabilis]BAU48709.1 Ni/Fe hydrogenase subunit alpha [Sulfurifustis variabilis]